MVADGLDCSTGLKGELKILNPQKSLSSGPEGTKVSSGRYWIRPPEGRTVGAEFTVLKLLATVLVRQILVIYTTARGATHNYKIKSLKDILSFI